MSKRFNLRTLMVVATLSSVAVGLAAWSSTLRARVDVLEQRVQSLEAALLVTTMASAVSPVGVPEDVDWAMQMDSSLMAR
ncbi:MAG: hypothetical protein ACRCT8_10275 [Lacipirellulaceae bacterium]